MILLLHPSHRKFIKTLYTKVGHNGYIALTNDDWTAFVNLWPKNNNNSVKIHQGAYKILLMLQIDDARKLIMRKFIYTLKQNK